MVYCTSNGCYIAIPPSGPETVHSVKVFNLVLQINKQTDDSTLLDIQTKLSDKKKREISDCLNDTLTNPCGQKFTKTILPSNTENMSNVGSNESDINKGNNKITELRAILQRESQNS